MRANRVSVAVVAVVTTLACAADERSTSLATSTANLRAAPTISPQQSNTTNRIIGVSPVDANVVWASGSNGTYLLTTDGGQHWRTRTLPGAETLGLRDVEGVTDRIAYILSIGSGTDSRIYKTEDGGDTWTMQAQNTDPNGFWDCFAFWTPRRAILMADSVDGRFPIHRTTDGTHWQDIGDRLPPAQPGESAFAASGTCAAVQGERNGWLGTGGSAIARVIATRDGGNSWTAYAAPIPGGPTSGVASIDFRNPRHGILGGGDVVASTVPQPNVARSNDGGRTWTLTTPTPFPGAVYGLTYTRNQRGDDDESEETTNARTVVATGPSGAAFTTNEGDAWTLLPGITNCWGVAFANDRTGWLVCGAGRIFRIDF